jgi:hypothetical protein
VTRLAAPLIAALILAACATPEVVDVRQTGDRDMNCEQIRAAHDDARDFERRARKERGATGTNVAAAIFFWPALLGTYKNTEDAIEAARDRQKHLERLADSKKCPPI